MRFQPEDWDDEEDGEWTAPTMANPEYKGPWKQKVCWVLDLSNFIWLNTRLMWISFLQKIKNPNYKGKWKAPMIANPGDCLSFEGFPCYPKLLIFMFRVNWLLQLLRHADFKDDPNIYVFPSLKYVGIELWQVFRFLPLQVLFV